MSKTRKLERKLNRLYIEIDDCEVLLFDLAKEKDKKRGYDTMYWELYKKRREFEKALEDAKNYILK